MARCVEFSCDICGTIDRRPPGEETLPAGWAIITATLPQRAGVPFQRRFGGIDVCSVACLQRAASREAPRVLMQDYSPAPALESPKGE